MDLSSKEIDSLIKLYIEGKKCDDMFPIKKEVGRQLEQLADLIKKESGMKIEFGGTIYTLELIKFVDTN